ncbi:GxxExxY protein [Algoriphagus lutimaris]|uniref:GxxExxY protein n=1 Tax=Algoriphagus lutimaris TaxID=613197 RepID=UPI00374216A2
MNENDLSKIIVDTAFKIYKKFGPGLLESVYEGIFAYDLRQKELLVETQVIIPVLWNNIKFDQGYRADIIVNKKVLIKLKSIEKLMHVHEKHVRTY